MVKFADVHAQSVGLYQRGGILRCLVPSGQSYQSTAPTGIIYDGIGQGGSFNYDNKISSILAAESFGISPVFGPHGYIAIMRSDTNLVEHHWIKEPPASVATYTDTWVRSLPFQPGSSMIRIADKIVATSPLEGYFRYCSTLNGPSDWVTTGDAGFEAAMQFVSGARSFIGLGIHRGLLAVFFSDAVQLWNMDSSPANIELHQVLNGPGTDFSGSIANILGDVIFLSHSGFASLATAIVGGVANPSTPTVTGETRFSSVGERIKSLTASIPSTSTAVSLWSQKRCQYLCAVGTKIYCYSFYEGSEIGPSNYWTVWDMPSSISAMAEVGGVVYVRSGNTVYSLDDTTGTNYTGSDLAWSFTLKPLGLNAPSLNKELTGLVIQCTGASTWTPIVDGRTLTFNAVTFPAGTVPIRSIINGEGRRISFSVTGTGRMRLDGAVIEAGLAGE